MYFYPKHIDESAVDALEAVGLTFSNAGEMFIPDNESEKLSENDLVLRGVHLTRHIITFNGHIDAPEVWDSLEGMMVPQGSDLNQCPTCGYWLSDRPDEKQHNEQCRLQYMWELV